MHAHPEHNDSVSISNRQDQTNRIEIFDWYNRPNLLRSMTRYCSILLSRGFEQWKLHSTIKCVK